VSQQEPGISWIENMLHVHTQEPGWVFPQLWLLVYDCIPSETLRERPIEGGEMKEVYQCQLLLGGESKKPWENKVVEEMSRLIRTRTHGTVCGQM